MRLRDRWERILRSHGLGVDQPMTDHGGGMMAHVHHPHPTRSRGYGRGRSTDKDVVKLRHHFDTNEVYIPYHQITAVRQMRDRVIPEWAFSDEEVQRLITRWYPRWRASLRARKKAGKLAAVIHFYYRMHLPRQIVRTELRLTRGTFSTIIRGIKFVSQGLTTSGKIRKGECL